MVIFGEAELLLTFSFIGTTYSCGLFPNPHEQNNLSKTWTQYWIWIVANYEGTNVEIIANEQGSFTTPSFVSFTDKERLIGESAKNQAAMNPRNTIFDIKLASPAEAVAHSMLMRFLGDWSDADLTIPPSRRMLSLGHSRSSIKMVALSSRLSTSVRTRSSRHKKSLQWFWPR